MSKEKPSDCGRWLMLAVRKLVRNPVKGLEVLIAALGAAGLVGGLVFAGCQVRDNARSVAQSAESVRVANRVQLYTSDVGLSREEFEYAGGKIWSLYSRVSPDDPANYCRTLLQLLSTNESFCGITNAAALYEALAATNTFGVALMSRGGDDLSASDITEIRRLYNYSSQVLDEMHFAYDCWGDGVITSNELATWIGYIKAIGPHPMFLAVLCRWHDKNYMCSNFADLVRHELEFRNDGSTNEANCRIIRYFYPEMAGPGFTNTLPACGEVWHGWSTNPPAASANKPPD